MRLVFNLFLPLIFCLFAGFPHAWAGASSPVLPIEYSLSASDVPIEPQKTAKKRFKWAKTPNPKKQVEPIPAGWYWAMFALTGVIALGSLLILLQIGALFGAIVYAISGWPILFYSIKLLLAALGNSDAFLPNARFWLGYLAFGTTLLGLLGLTSFMVFATIFGAVSSSVLLLSFVLSLAIPALMLIFNIIDQGRFLDYQSENPNAQ